MSLILQRRGFILGGLAVSLTGVRPGWATLPASIVDQAPIGRDKMLVVHEDASGRIIAADSSSYLVKNPTRPTDVIVVGSYGGTPILALLFSRGVKAIIATDAGIGKDGAGISGLKAGEGIGVPCAAIAAMSAETSNGRSTLLGVISSVNAQARALGVVPGQLAYEAAMKLTAAPPGRPVAMQAGIDDPPKVVEETPQGRIWVATGSLSFGKQKIPGDVFCSGANSSPVFALGTLSNQARGAIANDAGIARNDTAVEGVKILSEKGVPAASVGTMSARLGEGLSTWNDGVISVVNAPASARGIRVGMTAKEAARLMLA
jgi:hypothetical protein